MRFVLKTNIVLKTKTNLHSIDQKPQKEKKKWKEKKWTKVPIQLKKKNRIEQFETQNLRRGTTALVLVEDTKVMNKEEGKT